MAWVRFTEKFRWSPREALKAWSITYPAGLVHNVRRSCADEAIAKGKAQPAANPRRASL